VAPAAATVVVLVASPRAEVAPGVPSAVVAPVAAVPVAAAVVPSVAVVRAVVPVLAVADPVVAVVALVAASVPRVAVDVVVATVKSSSRWRCRATRRPPHPSPMA
jgi:hypothetical protein